MDTADKIIAFEKNLIREEKSVNTIEKYLRDVRAWQKWNAENGINAFTKEAVIAYKNALIAAGYKARSVNSMLCSVNAFLIFCGFGDCRVRTLKIQREVFRREEKELTRAEFERLCKTALSDGNKRLYMLLLTLCGTGIRVSELPFVTVESVKRGEAAVTLKGKTRRIFFVKALRKKLLRYAEERKIASGQIFITKNGNPLRRTNIWKEMKSLCLKAGVSEEKVFPHNLRHLFARVFYTMQKDIAKLADILGHSSVETTRIYIASTGSEHRLLMEKMRLIC